MRTPVAFRGTSVLGLPTAFGFAGLAALKIMSDQG